MHLYSKMRFSVRRVEGDEVPRRRVPRALRGSPFPSSRVPRLLRAPSTPHQMTMSVGEVRVPTCFPTQLVAPPAQRTGWIPGFCLPIWPIQSIIQSISPVDENTQSFDRIGLDSLFRFSHLEPRFPSSGSSFNSHARSLDTSVRERDLSQSTL